MDKRDSFIYRRKGMEMKSRNEKFVGIYRYPFRGVGCRIFPRDNDRRKRNCRSIIRSIVRDMAEGEKAESRQSQKGRSDMRQTITSLSSHRPRRHPHRCTREIPLVTRLLLESLLLSLSFPSS